MEEGDDLLDELAVTFVPLEEEAIREAAAMLTAFYVKVAPEVARKEGVEYPQRLVETMLEKILNDELRKSE